MKVKNPRNSLMKLVSLAGVIGTSVIVGLPVGAQGLLNPHPSIFNEPPYNSSGSTESTPSTPSMPSPPDAGSTPPSMPSPSPDTTSSTQDKDVVAVAASNNSFKTLTAALQAAGLTETLQGKGPFTIFAPNDKAFDALPPSALQELLKPENKEILAKILTYHVIPGKITSGDLKSGEVTTAEGSSVNVRVGRRGVMVNKARVIQADIQASNGVIHVIDKVLLPPDLKIK